jgi:hypothetical protein
MKLWKLSLCAGAASLAFATAAFADDTPAPPPPATAAAAPAPAAPAYSLGMDGPIVINPKPLTVDSGFLGSITINGALTGAGIFQDNPVGSDKHAQADLTNAQVFIEKTDGLFQFFVDVGEYSFPTVGTPYTTATKVNGATFGAIPIAYVKLQPTADWSIEAGKLPTQIGAEYNFTFENMNIERGLLWNQENLVDRGVQVNYSHGPLALTLSINDGFYSNALSWVTGSATYTFNPANILEFAAGGNTRKDFVSNSATSPIYNNSTIYNLIYTHTMGQWTFVPYLQYTSVPAFPEFGISSSSTFGGAVFASYAFPSESKLTGVTLPVRFEYISTTGNKATAPSLLYGPGSNAWSITVTPTYQYKIYFVRAELSYVNAGDTTPGDVFGSDGTARSQTRGLIEAGVVF